MSLRTKSHELTNNAWILLNFCPHVRHVRESKKGLVSGFHNVDYGFQVQDSLSGELGFTIPVVSGSPDSLSCISDSNAKDSGFYKQNFRGIGFWIPQAKTFWIPESFTQGGISAPERCFPEVLSIMFQQGACCIPMYLCVCLD